MAFIKISRYCDLGTAFYIKIQRFYFEKLLSSKYSTNIMYSMGTAYFHREKEDQNVDIRVCLKEYNLNKVLVFRRNVSENLNSFLSRLELKLNPIIQQKALKLSKQNKTLQDVSETCATFLLNNEEVSEDLRFEDIFQENFNGNLKLKISDSNYDVVINGPLILNLCLPKKLFVGNVIIPEKFEAQFTDRSSSEFIWYKSLYPQKKKFWEKCGEGFIYIPKVEDINYYLKLKCVPKMGQSIGPSFEIVSGDPVKNFNSLKEIINRHQFTSEKTKADEVRIVSYNILADTYTQTKEGKTQLFIFCNPAYIDFNYRKCLINSELIGYKADIICLQEVDQKFYKSEEMLFTELGYNCVYHEKEGSREGCLCIYDKNKFKNLSTDQYIFKKELLDNPLFEDIRINVKENVKLMQRLHVISSQLQVVVLECLSNQILIVGNTHFYFHPDADHIRLLQGVMSWKILINKFEEIKNQIPNKKVSIILCGDFNSTPECGFHQLLKIGSITSDHQAWKCKEDEEIKNISCESLWNMNCAYDNTQFTNFTPLFKGCLDYIYYQPDNLILKQTVPIPSEEILSENEGIPSQFFPSDHVALIADLMFKE